MREYPSSRRRENRKIILKKLKENPQGLSFMEFHNSLKSDIGSKSTLSSLLYEMRWEKEIEKDEVDGKYRLLDLSLYNTGSALTGAILRYVNEYSKNGSDPEKMLEALSKSIGALSLYCAIKQIETNKEWPKIVSDYVSKDNYLLAFLKRYIVYSGLELMGEEPTIPRVRELMSGGVDLMKEDTVFKAKLAELEYLSYDLYPSRLKEIINEFSKLEEDQDEMKWVRDYKS